MIIFIIGALVVFGMLAVFSAGAPEGADVYGNTSYFLIKHTIALVIGAGLLLFAYVVDYHYWKKIAKPFAYVVTALIIATLIPGLGKTIYGSSRWLAGLPIQPSELCKFSVVTLVSSALVEAKTIFNSKMLKHLFIVGVMIFVLLIQPNLSNAAILFALTLALLLAGGVSFRLIGLISLPGVVAVLLKFMQPYQLARIKGWLDPWADPQVTGYNLIQSYYAIGSGGFFGVGYGNSRQKLFWLPFSQTDFIFAVIAEELGFIGCLVLVGLFVALLIRGLIIAKRCSDSFGTLLAFGITFVIALQAFINIGVAVGVLPVTGVTLPLISYGGTSVVLTLFMLGVLLNISRKRVRAINP
ncbi:MAG: cell division protein FtsW [Candidatus Melainabacteria bacterium GWF2_37_15]|nr:MAG: cell division protein FtsW [Candidatus Melainabacteria bacterium GWF2_37_15]